jgi:hypothetical protein
MNQGRYRRPMSAQEQACLDLALQGEIEQLEALLGRDLSEWRTRR